MYWTDAANQHFQHLTAVGAKAAVYALARECYAVEDSVLYQHDVRPVVFIHDEILAEVPAEQPAATECAKAMAEVMVTAMQTWMPVIPVKAEPCLMRCWYKDAEPVWKDGLLLPWEPAQ